MAESRGCPARRFAGDRKGGIKKLVAGDVFKDMPE